MNDPLDILDVDALLTDEERDVRDLVRRVADERVRPHVAGWRMWCIMAGGPGNRRSGTEGGVPS